MPAVVEDTLEAHTYGSRLAAVAESNWDRTHQTHKRGDETMGLLKLSWCRVVIREVSRRWMVPFRKTKEEVAV